MAQRVIFSTTDIQTEHELYPGQRPVSIETYRGRVLETYSTGRLEAAFGRGMEIYLVSIRQAFGSHDRWWRELIRPEHVWQTAGVMSACRHSINGVLLEPWTKLYALLGIPWTDGMQDPDQARAALVADHGFTDGKTFRGYAAKM